jgi:HK97 family phage prohead protease
MKAEIKTFSKKAFTDVDTKKGVICGYLNRYDLPDNVGDVILSGAGKKTVTERGPSGANLIKHLWNHNSDYPIGKYLVLEERESGVYYEAQMSKTQKAQDVLIQVDEGIITTNSFGFNTLQSYDENGIRYITEYKMWEGSCVSIAANDLAVITQIKNMTSEDAIKTVTEKITALKNAIRKSEASDEAIEQLYWDAQKAEQYLKELMTEPPKGTQDEKTEPSKDTQSMEELSQLLDKMNSNY